MATAKSAPRVVHVCAECDTTHPKWTGRCSGCGGWNTLVEATAPGSGAAAAVGSSRPGPTRLRDVATDHADPRPTAIAELDRVLGGGLVPGSVTLLGGEPGIGKSTLLLQLLTLWAGPTLYVTAEESGEQVRRRAERLGCRHDDVWLHAETLLDPIIAAIADVGPELVVVDSIQTVNDPALGATPGGVAQVRGCAHRLVNEAKARGVSIVLVGHVTKDGALAGPRVLEHVVDTVLQFEGDRHHSLRLLRASKHRFGSTNELGLFEMTPSGLGGVPDPSTLFLADRRAGVAGSAVVPTIEGRRPIVVEVQALATRAPDGVPARRTTVGLDGGRLAMLLAVLERRGGFRTSGVDVYATTAGGFKLTEPGLDVGTCLATVSALTDVALPADLVSVGEVGLGGELRQVAQIPRRLAEAHRLGFRRAIVPANAPGVDVGIELLRAGTIDEALAFAGLLTEQRRTRRAS